MVEPFSLIETVAITIDYLYYVLKVYLAYFQISIYAKIEDVKRLASQAVIFLMENFLE